MIHVKHLAARARAVGSDFPSSQLTPAHDELFHGKPWKTMGAVRKRATSPAPTRKFPVKRLHATSTGEQGEASVATPSRDQCACQRRST